MSENQAKPAGRLTRRDVLKTAALLGGAGLLASQTSRFFETLARAEQNYLTPLEEYSLAQPEHQLYSVCLQCNTGCGIKVKLLDGVAVKIDGNPLSPWTLHPPLPYKTSPFEIATVEGALCPKGQAGLQTIYDPYRIRKVLKRQPGTKRGQNQWVTVSFEQAITEIVEGGDHFGEGHVSGLRELWAVRDPNLAKQMAEDVQKIWSAHERSEKEKLVAEFQEKYREQLDKLIDPEHPDLGPKNNQLVFLWGRVKGGREHLIRRFTQDAFGSVNAHGHTTVCQGSLYFTGKAMSEQYKDGKWTGGQKFYWQADTENSEFLIFVGASPFEANYGPPVRAPHITQNMVDAKLKIAVVDPRLSKTAAKAWKWLPIKPGTEAALALAMIRWIIENGRYDKKYLENANKAAAQQDGEPTWCNASWLVKIENGRPSTFLRASEIGLSEQDRFIVSHHGQALTCDPYDESMPVEGELLVDMELSGIRVKSGLQVLYDSAREHTLDEWAQICGLKVQDIIELAREFTAHGKHAAADIHRGVSQHTNGFYNVFAWYALNLLIGNYDWAGGLIKKTEYDAIGDKDGKPFPLKKLHPGKTVPFGVSNIRHGVKYEETTLFSGYPAKRPWFPLSSDIYQEVIPSVGDAYPYPVKALFLYMGTPAYSLPAGQTNIDILSDPKKIPLIVACDITVGETSLYADYIFPDLTYLERWEFHGSHPNIAPKVQPVRQPVIAPIPETVTVYGEEMPISLEALILGIAEKMGLPGFGPGGLGDASDFNRPEDYYLKMVANVAFGDKADGSDAVPDADDRELQLFVQARRHLPSSVFDSTKWQRSVSERFWRKIIYVLNRGGRFQDHEKAYTQDGKVTNPYGTLINLYQEKTATTKNSMTGEPFVGYPLYLPAPVDVLGRPIGDEKAGFDLNLITYRVIQQTKSRTISNYWLLGIEPENAILINRRDAERLGLHDGDHVKIVSASNPEGVWDLKNGRKIPMIGKLKVVEGLRPGVVAFSLGYGHWAYGSQDIVIDGRVIRRDERRARGIHANAAMRTDPVLKNTCLQDITGGSVSFYDSRVQLVKV
jgi:tetrathionate reductase subunit A